MDKENDNKASDVKEVAQPQNQQNPIISHHEHGATVIASEIELDSDNLEFISAMELALYSDKNIFLTGKAGTGKTTFLKYLKSHTDKQMAILAPTGVAAINAGGTTIHSFFKIAPGMYSPNDNRLRTKAPSEDTDQRNIYNTFEYTNARKRTIQKLQMLVIDEISMVRADLLDVIDTLLRIFRHNNKPFGGVQMIMIGDAFQLPPVLKKEDRGTFLINYDSEFFFDSKVVQSLTRHNALINIELKKVYRQKEQAFIEALNRIRIGVTTQEDIAMLNKRVITGFEPKAEEQYIILGAKNDYVDSTNIKRLEALASQSFTYEATITGDLSKEGNLPAAEHLTLKVGAQVMFVKNNWQKDYYNGLLGVVKNTGDDSVVVTANNKDYLVTAETWEYRTFEWNEENGQIEEKIIGTFSQIPLRLAWAVTIHKSQGLTFDKIIAKIDDSFAEGQTYVALSRCTSIEGLVLTTPISNYCIKTSNKVITFSKTITPNDTISKMIDQAKTNKQADTLYRNAHDAFIDGDVELAFNTLLHAIQIRDDIETDRFHRYIVSQLKFLLRYKSRCQEVENELRSARDKIESQQSQLNANELSNKEKDKRINNLNTSIEKLHKENASLIKTNNDIIIDLDHYKKEYNKVDHILDDYIKSVDGFKFEIGIKNGTIESLNQAIESLVSELQTAKENHKKDVKTISELKSEIKRLKSITWLQKLFGKK